MVQCLKFIKIPKILFSNTAILLLKKKRNNEAYFETTQSFPHRISENGWTSIIDMKKTFAPKGISIKCV